ncbi:MAG: hypothetical protein AB7E79_03755 [Rhodospirillaceae bacterium]
MKATIRLVLLTALRDRLFTGLIVLLALSAALAVFLGGTALTEQIETAVVFAAGAGRIVLVLGLTIFAALHIQSLFETREVEAILARALSRSNFVVAYWIGIACVAAALAAVFGAGIAMLTSSKLGALWWTGTLIAECIIVMAVAIFAGLMLERATPTVLFTMGFYALARLLGFFVGIREAASDLSAISRIVKWGLDAILLFVPRLDLFAQTQWLVYGARQMELSYVAAQVALFLALILAAASFDLSRKQF